MLSQFCVFRNVRLLLYFIQVSMLLIEVLMGAIDTHCLSDFSFSFWNYEAERTMQLAARGLR